MTCKYGELKFIRNNSQCFFCSIRQNGCPFVRWCYIEKTYKMLVGAKNCSNYSEGDGDKTPSPSEIVNG